MLVGRLHLASAALALLGAGWLVARKPRREPRVVHAWLRLAAGIAAVACHANVNHLRRPRQVHRENSGNTVLASEAASLTRAVTRHGRLVVWQGSAQLSARSDHARLSHLLGRRTDDAPEVGGTRHAHVRRHVHVAEEAMAVGVVATDAVDGRLDVQADVLPRIALQLNGRITGRERECGGSGQPRCV